MMDFNWNPTKDEQAQARSYRFGQDRVVDVYRLCSKGCIEEAIYLRQLYKTALGNVVLGEEGKKQRKFVGIDKSSEK